MQAAVKYAVDAVNYLMDAVGSSLLTEIYYLSRVLQLHLQTSGNWQRAEREERL